MALLAAHRLDVSIAGQSVCRGLDLMIEDGQCWGLLGRNGVGKTTLLLTLGGIRSPDAGEIFFRGTLLSRLSRRSIAQGMAILFQEHDDAFPSTVLETALVGRHPHLGPWQWEGAEDIRLATEALEEMGVAHMRHRWVGTLSGGERRRVEIAAALTQAPVLLLMDEPTNHLDLHHQIAVLDRLNRRRRGGVALFMSLHDINLAARFCDHVLLLFGDGAAVAGATEEVLTENNLARLYQHPIHTTDGSGRRLYYPD
jgi:iron complex transport system ATP-binding protein